MTIAHTLAGIAVVSVPHLLLARGGVAQAGTAPAVTGIVARVTSQGNASVSWNAVPGASSYFVVRWNAGDPSCCKAVSAPALAGTSWRDGTLPKAGMYRYRVYAATGAGTYAGETQLSYTPGTPGSTGGNVAPAGSGTISQVANPPPPQGTGTPRGTNVGGAPSHPAASSAAGSNPAPPSDPAEFKATQSGEGEVTFTWNAVPGVTQYLIAGPGTGNGVTVPGNASGTPSHTLKGLPLGTQTWTIASVYNPGGVRTASSDWPRATVTVDARSGKYRVTMYAFVVNRQTSEGPALDGRGDEVYLAAYVASRNLVTQSWGPKGPVRSAVFGDILGANGRQQAGSVSPQGGLRTADEFPISGRNTPPAAPKSDILPMLLWEGTLTDDVDLVLLAPAIWESDNDDANYMDWTSRIATQLPTVIGWGSMAAEIGTSLITPVRDASTSNLLRATGATVDHPIGMTSTIHYSQQYLALTRKKVETALSTPTPGLAPGVIAIAMTDQATSVNFGGGYTVYLRLERVP